MGRGSGANKFYVWRRPYHDTRRSIKVLIFIRICLVVFTVRECANKGQSPTTKDGSASSQVIISLN